MMFRHILVGCMLCVFACNNDPSSVTDVGGDQGNQVDYPCLYADEECQNSIEVRGGKLQFFSTFHIDSISNVPGAIVVVHGNNRNADDYFDKIVSVVTDQGMADDLIVIAPRFIMNHEKSNESDWYWNSSSWKWGMQSYSSSSGTSASSFELLDSLIVQLANKDQFLSLSNILITGHSSGAAFVHHYLASKTQNLYNNLHLHFAVVNTQYFFHPNATRLLEDGSIGLLDNCDNYNSWPLGLDDLNPYMELIGANIVRDNFFSNRVEYFISEYDTLTSSIDSGCEYAILGDNRYEKIVNFMSYMNLVFPNNDHGHTVIPALGHTSNTFSSNIFKEYLNSIF